MQEPLFGPLSLDALLLAEGVQTAQQHDHLADDTDDEHAVVTEIRTEERPDSGTESAHEVDEHGHARVDLGVFASAEHLAHHDGAQHHGAGKEEAVDAGTGVQSDLGLNPQPHQQDARNARDERGDHRDLGILVSETAHGHLGDRLGDHDGNGHDAADHGHVVGNMALEADRPFAFSTVPSSAISAP